MGVRFHSVPFFVVVQGSKPRFFVLNCLSPYTFEGGVCGVHGITVSFRSSKWFYAKLEFSNILVVVKLVTSLFCEKWASPQLFCSKRVFPSRFHGTNFWRPIHCYWGLWKVQHESGSQSTGDFGLMARCSRYLGWGTVWFLRLLIRLTDCGELAIS